MKFFDEAGKIALGTRVRFLGEKIGIDAAEIYKAYGTNLHPKWFPVFYALSKSDQKTVTSIASYIGHSHVSVVKIIAEMAKADLVIEKANTHDRRSTLVELSKKGRQVAQKIELQYQDINSAIEELSSRATHNLWEALQEWDRLFEQMPLLDRVLKKKRQRESADIKIEPYQAWHAEAFRKLNEEWITTHFKMEKPDYDELDNPKEYILDRGGFIFIATIGKKVVGTCAIVWREDLETYAVAKMAVAKSERGKNIGFILGKAAIEKAKSLNADRVFLESNTVLEPAIKLYRKLGFKEITGHPTPYERCNIQMELKLKS